MPRSRSGASDGDLERHVRAQRRAADDRLVDLEVVEQADDLLGEEAHAVAPHVRRAVGLAVAEQVERHDAVAALGERPRQRLVHALAQQQPVQEHRHARALAVDLVGQPAVLARERPGLLARRHRPDCRAPIVGAVPVLRPMTRGRRPRRPPRHRRGVRGPRAADARAAGAAGRPGRGLRAAAPDPRHRPRRLLGRRGRRRARRRGGGAGARALLGPLAAGRAPGRAVVGHRARAAGARARARRAARPAGSSSPPPTRARCARTPAPASRCTRR